MLSALRCGWRLRRLSLSCSFREPDRRRWQISTYIDVHICAKHVVSRNNSKMMYCMCVCASICGQSGTNYYARDRFRTKYSRNNIGLLSISYVCMHELMPDTVVQIRVFTYAYMRLGTKIYIFNVHQDLPSCPFK